MLRYIALEQLLLQVAVLFFGKPLADSSAFQSENVHGLAFWLFIKVKKVHPLPFQKKPGQSALHRIPPVWPVSFMVFLQTVLWPQKYKKTLDVALTGTDGNLFVLPPSYRVGKGRKAVWYEKYH
jgi:hypothetical protein